MVRGDDDEEQNSTNEVHCTVELNKSILHFN